MVLKTYQEGMKSLSGELICAVAHKKSSPDKSEEPTILCY
jgi:hypothetical protein